MRVSFPPFISSLVFALMPLSAFADVTPEDAWQRWQSVLTQYGGVLTADAPVQADGALTIAVMTVQMDSNEGMTSTRVAYPETTFLPNGDGTVSVMMGGDIQISLVDTPPLQAPYQISGRIQLGDLSITASGHPEEMRFDYSGDALTMVLDEATSDGQTTPISMSARIDTPSGAATVTTGATIINAQSFTADTFSFSFDLPDDGTQMEFMMENLSGQSTVEMAAGGDLITDDIFAAPGASLDASYDYERAAMTFAQMDDGDFYSGTITSGASQFTTVLKDQISAYSGESTDLDVNIAGPLPTPVVAQLDSYTYAVSTPMTASEVASNIALRMDITGLTVSDALWNTYDPDGVLARDAASVSLDISGKANPADDAGIPDPFAPMAALSGLQNLTLNTLFVDAIGAQLRGSGVLDFSQSEAATFMGIQQPVGSIDLNLVGGTGVLDKLTALGMVAPEQAMGAKMMIGMFAQPGPGADELSTKIQMSPEGRISVNGQRIR